MTGRKKIFLFLLPIISVVIIFTVLCMYTACLYSPLYLWRVITHFDSDTDDYLYFPSREISESLTPYTYERRINTSISSMNIKYRMGKNELQAGLYDFLKNSDTHSFLILKDDVLIYEEYFAGYDELSINTSFSMSKSIISLLVGKAIEEGYIKSVYDPISDYIKELKNTDVGNVSVEKLLLMRSDIEYNEDKFLWFGDDSLTYWNPDLRSLALENIFITDKYSGGFHYNNYSPLLLGIIIERCTGKSVSQYFEEKFWSPLGSEYSSSWSLDSEKSGFEKMESGFNFRAIDFIKLGSLILHGGCFNGNQIISEDWIEISTVGDLISEEYDGSFLENRGVGYKYMWYYCPTGSGGADIIAWGKSDQILYISPENRVVILRTGKSDGGIKNWEIILRYLANNVNVN